MTRTDFTAALSTGALALTLAVPAALADNHTSGPDYETAQALADRARKEVRSAFEEGSYTSLASWMADNSVDAADFHFSGEAVLSDGPATTYELSVSGDELAQLAESVTGMQGVPGDLVEEYELDVVVNAAWKVPGEVSGAEIAFYESGRFGERDGMVLPTGPFSSSTVCAMHLDGAEPSRIRVASCKTTSLL